MIWQLLAVLDRKTEAFLPPMAYAARGAGVRDFTDALNGDSPMARHPEDYMLYQVGTYDDHSGLLVACELEPIVGGSSVAIPKIGPKMEVANG